MAIVRFIFVSPEGLVHQVIDGVVEAVEKLADPNADSAHVAIEFEGEVNGRKFYRGIEAVAPKVDWFYLGKYEDEPSYQYKEFEVTDEQFAAAVTEAKKMRGLKYGTFTTCVVGGLHDAVGDKVSAEAATILDKLGHINCSATGTRIARAMWPEKNFLADHTPSQITPEHLQTALEGI